MSVDFDWMDFDGDGELWTSSFSGCSESGGEILGASDAGGATFGLSGVFDDAETGLETGVAGEEEVEFMCCSRWTQYTQLVSSWEQ